MPNLATILRQTVVREGIIPFARFMEMALYWPETGYYERECGRVGRAGDFFTSVSTGPLFGRLLAFQFAEWADDFAQQPCQIVEAGAHDGRLALDLLTWLEARRPGLLERLEYWLIEPSPRRQEWQRAKLGNLAGRVRWFDSLKAVPSTGVHGVIFANELLDAFPVHRLGWDATARCWFEWGVGWEAEHFVWRRMEPTEAWTNCLEETGFQLPTELRAALLDGFILEVAPGAATWWRQAATVLRSGKLLTLDYGLTAEEFLTPQRASGTLRAYSCHQASTDLLASPGEQDLTAHINFTQLQRAGEAAGLTTMELSPQSRFLTRIAEQVWRDPSASDAWTPAEVRQFQTLIHPEHLGRPFRVLVQSR